MKGEVIYDWSFITFKEYIYKKSMRFIIQLNLLFCFVTNLHAQERTAADPYDYKTTLKGGYKIRFVISDSMEYLYLQKGKKHIKNLSAMSAGLSYQNLGFVSADFDKYFLLEHVYGAGNPHPVELFEKETRNDFLQGKAALIDVQERQPFLLYCNAHVPSWKDQMILLNINTIQSETFPFPKEIFSEPQVLNRIKIKSLTADHLIITYGTEKGEKRKTYKRNL